MTIDLEAEEVAALPAPDSLLLATEGDGTKSPLDSKDHITKQCRGALRADCVPTATAGRDERSGSCNGSRQICQKISKF
jgi:hypothetical protein